MKTYMSIIFMIIALYITGCAAVPKQIVDAMEIQQKEIERVKLLYFENVNNQLDAIEKYRIAILDMCESQHITKYCMSLDEVSQDGIITLVEIPATGDKNLDHINIHLLETIQQFYKSEREKVMLDIRDRRKQILLAQQNYENIELLNSVMNDYVKSLSRLKNSQDKMARAIGSTLGRIGPIPFSWDKIPDPLTLESLFTTLNLTNNDSRIE